MCREESGEHEIDIPLTKDPEAINLAIGMKVAGNGPADDDGGDGWEVRNHSWCGPLLTIEVRSDRDHLCIMVVNYEDQEQ